MVEGNGIFLKDRSGNTNFYRDAIMLEIPGQSWDGATTKEITRVFAEPGRFKAYALGVVDNNGFRKYKVLKRLEFLPSDRSVFFGLSKTQFDELAGKPTNDPNYIYLPIIVTPKNLVVGDTYVYSDMEY